MNRSTTSSSSPHRSNGTAAGGGGNVQLQSGGTPVHRLTPQEAALRGASLAFQKQQHNTTLGKQTTGGGNISRQTTGSTISRHPTGSSVRSQRDYADEAAERERDRERKALFLGPATPEKGGGGGQQQLLLPPRPGAAPSEGKSASFIAATLAASRSVSPRRTAPAGLEGGGLSEKRSQLLREPVHRRRGSAASSVDELTDTTSLAPANSLISLFEERRDADGEARGEGPARMAKRKTKPRAPPKPQMGNGNADDESVVHRSKSTPVLQPAIEVDPEKRPEIVDSKAGPDGPITRRLKPARSQFMNGKVDGKVKEESVVARSKPSSLSTPKIDVDPAKNDGTPTRRLKPRSSQSALDEGKSDEEPSTRSNESKSGSKPSIKPKAKVVVRAETPSPVVRRADTVIVSPKPRRPETKPRLDAPAFLSDANQNSNVPVEQKATTRPQVPKPKNLDLSPRAISHPTEDENLTTQQRRPSIPAKSPVLCVKSRPLPPRKSSGLSERLSPELKRRNTHRRSIVSSHDGQEESRLRTGQGTSDSRPTTSDSKSSNDSFVSASSVLSRDETDSLLTVEAPSSRSITPKGPASRPTSTQPSTPLPVRRSVTGSSQLPLYSLSDAIMAGSLASARLTPISLNEGRTPPPLPPSRRKGGSAIKKASSRRSSPHRLKHTLRQPKSLSDDEDTRRPHHKKGINHKKHAHHEGYRNRWREEITEREKKRYEAVWASNRGALLVASSQQLACADPARHPDSHQRPRKPPRYEGYEELSEHVANVVVRDLWSRSRLPEFELAEVWDLVYGRARAPGSVLHGALNKQEFVVGMWLIDQRLRGRKIPPRVTESVWDSAKGLRVLSPDHGHGGHHKGKGKGRAR